LSARENDQKKVTTETVITTQGKRYGIVKEEIRAAYLDNFSRIIVRFDPKFKSESRRLVRSLIGELTALELIEEDCDKVVAKSFLDYGDVSITQLIRRVDNMTRAMLAESVELLETNSDPKPIILRDKEVNRMTFLLLKVLRECNENQEVAKMNELTRSDILKYWQISFLLEEVADVAKREARWFSTLLESKAKFDKKGLQRMYSRVIDTYKEAMTSIYKKDLRKGHEVERVASRLMKECNAYAVKNPSVLVTEITGKFKAILGKIRVLLLVSLYLD